VSGMERGSGATNEHGPRYQILQVAFGRQKPFPVRNLFDRGHNEGIVPCRGVAVALGGLLG
jgi:hypothetical protein